ncbi:hypothetical protein NIES2101_40075 [Calothrix sp. HK-06]|nr:hypothetical protein NIES2101_40075 [Calothrix sp. HK-06]
MRRNIIKRWTSGSLVSNPPPNPFVVFRSLQHPIIKDVYVLFQYQLLMAPNSILSALPVSAPGAEISCHVIVQTPAFNKIKEGGADSYVFSTKPRV